MKKKEARRFSLPLFCLVGLNCEMFELAHNDTLYPFFKIMTSVEFMKTCTDNLSSEQRI